MTRTAISNLKLFSGIKIIKGFFLYIKPLGPFPRQCQVFHFRTYPEFETLSRFRDKTHLPVFEQSSIQNKAHYHNLQNKSLKVKIIL